MTTSMGNTPTTSTPATGTPFGPAPNPVRERPHAPLSRPLENCPGCGSWQLQPVVVADASRVHFLCGSCSRCWRVELGYVQRVNPERCDGCLQPEHCAAAYAKDHPIQG